GPGPGLAAKGLEPDENQQRPADPAPEHEVEQRPAGGEHGGRGSDGFEHHGASPFGSASPVWRALLIAEGSKELASIDPAAGPRPALAHGGADRADRR